MEYVCKLGTSTGHVVSRTEEAASEEELRARLTAEGYLIFSARPREILKGKLARLRRPKIKPDEFMIFNQQFLTLSKSGLPLQKSLELLAQQTRSDALRAGIEGVRDKVRAGALLSEAFDAVGLFPKVYCATLRAGERSGSLDRTLAQYLVYQKTSRTFRKRFLSALIYPAFLLVFLSGLVSGVIWFIIPKFAELYRDLDVELPGVTVFLINFSEGVKHYGAVVLLLLVMAVISLRTAWRSPVTRLTWERIKFRFPLAGTLLLKFSVAEFARTLATLLQGGIPLVTALETARESVSSPLLAQAIVGVQKEVTGGGSLSGALRKSGFFPEIALNMVEVGETTGALPHMLESLADFFEEDVNIDLAALVALVDPVMLAVIAAVVAFVLIAFYMPMFSMAVKARY
jgi:type IV pilus assembly protein PilC